MYYVASYFPGGAAGAQVRKRVDTNMRGQWWGFADADLRPDGFRQHAPCTAQAWYLVAVCLPLWEHFRRTLAPFAAGSDSLLTPPLHRPCLSVRSLLSALRGGAPCPSAAPLCERSSASERMLLAGVRVHDRWRPLRAAPHGVRFGIW